jgi:hypothetical protein
MKKIIPFLLLFTSCVTDTVHPIAVVKNISKQDIIVTFQRGDSINDKSLFYGSKYFISVDSSKSIFVLGYPYNEIHFFIFQADSVNKNIAEGKVEGIIKKSLLQKLFFLSDSLKKNDTIIYNGY